MQLYVFPQAAPLGNTYNCPQVQTQSPASKAYEVFLLFVASNYFVRYARMKVGEPGDEATNPIHDSHGTSITQSRPTCLCDFLQIKEIMIGVSMNQGRFI